MNPAEAGPKLHVNFSPDSSRPMVQLYGNPQGLRQLAHELLRIAAIDQTPSVGHDPVEHFHYKAKTTPWIIANSVELTLGRMDHRETGCTEWYEENVVSTRTYLQQLLDRLDELDGQSPL